mgnify:FL=1
MRRLLALFADRFLSLLLFAVKVTAGLALVLAFPVFCVYWSAAGGSFHPTVEVRDEAGVLRSTRVGAEIEGLTFDKRVRIVVLTMPGRLSGSLDHAVLDYAHRQPDPTALLENPVPYPERFRDGLVILAVSPRGREVGCYFGKDVQLSLDAQKDIQDAAKDQFRRSDWPGGVLSMAREYADAANSGAWETAGKFALAGAASVGGAVWLFLYFRSGLRAFKNVRAARDHYSRVVRDYDAIGRYAELIPEDSFYGAETIARYRAFCKEYAGFPRIAEDFVGDFSGPDWFRKCAATSAKAFRKRAFALDSQGRAVVKAAELLTMSPGWKDVWANEVGRVMEDVERILRLRESIRKLSSSKPQSVRAPFFEDAQELDAWVSVRLARLEALVLELETGETGPSDALEELDRMSDEIHDRAERLIRAASRIGLSRRGDRILESYEQESSPSNEESYSGSWKVNGVSGSYNPYTTIRPAFDFPPPRPSNVGKTPLTFALLLGAIWIAVVGVVKSIFDGDDDGDSSYSGSGGGSSGSGSSGSGSGSSSSF